MALFSRCGGVAVLSESYSAIYKGREGCDLAQVSVVLTSSYVKDALDLMGGPNPLFLSSRQEKNQTPKSDLDENTSIPLGMLYRFNPSFLPTIHSFIHEIVPITSEEPTSPYLKATLTKTTPGIPYD